MRPGIAPAATVCIPCGVLQVSTLSPQTPHCCTRVVHFTTYAVAAKVAGGRGRCAHFSLSVDRLRGMEGEAAYYDIMSEWNSHWLSHI